MGKGVENGRHSVYIVLTTTKNTAKKYSKNKNSKLVEAHGARRQCFLNNHYFILSFL